jgi:hypothetical protein
VKFSKTVRHFRCDARKFCRKLHRRGELHLVLAGSWFPCYFPVLTLSESSNNRRNPLVERLCARSTTLSRRISLKNSL